jgi:YVTN family beta-propeller protein
MACGSSTTEPGGPTAATVIVTPDTIRINQKDSTKVDVSVLDANQELLAGAAVTFHSSDTKLVTVSSTGVVHSVGPSGATQIVVKSGNASTTVPVTIVPVPLSVSVTPNPAAVLQKDTLTLVAKVVDAIGNTIPGAPIAFSSTDTTIVNVSQTGLLTSVGPSGGVTISVSSGALVTSVPVVVTQVPTTLKPSVTQLTMGTGTQEQLGAQVLDAIGQVIPNSTISFSSDKTGIVTVSSTGLLTSVGPTGTATITITSGSLHATVGVTVLPTTHPVGNIANTLPLPSAFGVAISSNGVLYASQLSGSIGRMDLPTLAFDATFSAAPGSSLDGIAFNASGSTAYVAGASGGLGIIDVATNTVTGTVPPPSGFGGAFSVAVSPNGNHVYLGGSGAVFAINPDTKAVDATITVPGTANHMALHPSMPFLYVSLVDASQVVEINTQTNAVTRTFNVGPTPQGVAVSLDGTELYVALESGALTIVDLSTGALTSANLQVPGFGLALSPDGAQLYIAASQVGRVFVVDRISRAIIKTINTGGTPRRVTFDASGKTAAVANEDGWVDIIQ